MKALIILTLFCALTAALLGSFEKSKLAQTADQSREKIIEQAALNAFKNQPVYISSEGGKQIEIDDPEQAKSLKVDLFKRSLGRKAEAKRPAIRLEAESRIRDKQISLVTVSWEDLSGKNESIFVIENPKSCNLKTPSILEIEAHKIPVFECLEKRSFAQKLTGTKRILVSIEPITEKSDRWTKLVHDEIADMATEHYIKEKG